jgi:signal transduction histidine kinase
VTQGALPPPQDPPVPAHEGRFRTWLRNLSVAGRVALGFAVALMLVILAAGLGLATIFGMNRDIGVFSEAADATGQAAAIGVSFARLEVSIREQLVGSDAATIAPAQTARDDIKAAIARLRGNLGDSADRAATDKALHYLDAYWGGIEKILALRTERRRLLDGDIGQSVRTIRERLDQYKDAGGYDAATLSTEMSIAVTGMQDHLIRWIERRSPGESAAARDILATIQNRIGEMNRYLWVPGIKQTYTDLTGLLGTVDRDIAAIDQSLSQEDATRADILAPNAAGFAAAIDGLRGRSIDEALNLRGTLMNGGERYLKIAAVIGGVVFVLGLFATWYAQRSIAKPVKALTAAVSDLASGRTGVSVPAIRHADELARLAEAVSTLDAAARESEDLRHRAETMHDQLLAEKQRVDSENQAKSEFLVNMGHQVHRPLTEIAHQAETLMGALHRAGHGDLAEDAERLQWTTEQLTQLVESILDYAKIEAGMSDLELQEVEVGRLIAEVRERALAEADINGNTLTAFATPGVGRMRTDFVKVRQILLNLVDNGCRFTRDGEVTLTAERNEDTLRFVVADTGCGFPSGQIERMFRPFTCGFAKVGGTRGAGLGLTVAAHYCAMLGGRIEVASSPDKGSRVIVELPSAEPERSLAAEPGRPLLTVAEAAAD